VCLVGVEGLLAMVLGGLVHQRSLELRLRWALGRDNGRRGRLQGFLMKRLGALVATEMAGEGGSPTAAALAAMAAVCAAAVHGSRGGTLPLLK
jgi:hypothetical protein